MKTTITKSKAGHYHVTVRDLEGRVVFFGKFGSLEEARRASKSVS